jgi:hypothetical protein
MSKRFFPIRLVLAFSCAAFLLSLTLVFPASNAAGTSQPSPPKFYFGNFHAHTSYSDGSGTPKENSTNQYPMGIDHKVVRESRLA